MKALVEFLQKVDNSKLTATDRACALMWLAGRDDATIGLTANEMANAIELAGHPKQNVSRLDKQISRDPRTIKGRGIKKWRLGPRARGEFEEKYKDIVRLPRNAPPSDSVLPHELFDGTRGYLERVVHQINISYDNALFDCCAVMCRRLLETLIIETYEAEGRPSEIKASDGNYFMFSDLLRVLGGDKKLKLSRNGLKGLRDFKRLGDLSAHNRRFNARRSDIDKIQDGLRVAAEELLHLSKLA